MQEVINKILKFRDDRDWKQFHTPHNLATSIVLEASELLENFQWNDEYDLQNVKEELADIMTYCLLLADVLDIDYKEVILDKIKKNELKYPVEKCKSSSKKYTELGD